MKATFTADPTCVKTVSPDRTNAFFSYAQRALDRMDRNLTLDEAKVTLTRLMIARRQRVGLGQLEK
jgi:hypothetical protein